MNAISCLFLLVSGTGLCDQERSKFYSYWIAPPQAPVATTIEREIPPVFLRRSRECEIPDGARVAQGWKTPDGLLCFFLHVGGRAQQLTFKPRNVGAAENANEGIFRMIIGCGYPEFVFVSGSDAESNLLSLLRRERARTVAQVVKPSEPSKECGDPRPETLATLNALLEYFPAAKPESNIPNTP